MGLSIATVTALAVLAGGYSTLAASATKKGDPGATTQTSQYITEAAAKKAALNHAGIAENDASFITAKIDIEHGKTNYDIEFYVGNKEYDYEIDAVTGTILTSDLDIEDYTTPSKKVGIVDGVSSATATTSATSQTKNGSETNYIDKAAAKKAALNHAGFQESDVFGLKAEFDMEHGKAEYEVDFHVGRTEYEYDIDAVTGTVLYFDADDD